jgi:hypothetical protein
VADDYLATALAHGYADIFRAALEQDRAGAGDLVVGLSGSGQSENIITALEWAKAAGAQVFCLGGRDGGRMRVVCGDERSLIVPSASMEVIEDLHLVAVLVVLDALVGRRGMVAALARFVERFALFLTPDNLEELVRMVEGVWASGERNGRVFVLGLGLGANHLRADLGRGASNGLPIRGLAAPECFTMNSAQATANDDGPDFILADGLAKHDPGANDFAILCDLPGTQALLGHCRELLDPARTPWQAIGDTGVRLDMFRDFDEEFAVAMLGHACGEVIRAQLQERWRVRELALRPEFPPGQKKLGAFATLALETRLRREGLIAADEVVTFCYGRAFAVRDPATLGRERGFY